MMRRRPRKVFKVVVFLLLLIAGGVIVNVAVAWGCLSSRPIKTHDRSSLGVTDKWGEGLTAGLPLRSLKWPLDKDYGHDPERIIWPGFAINTMFYAGVLWMVFAFPFVLRRRRRIKRGLCPACAYPVGQSPVCTECGKPIEQSAISGQQSAKAQT